MTLLERIAHGLISVLASFARVVLGALDVVEGGLRSLMSGAGLSADVQTLLLFVLLVLFLFAVLRLMKGRLRLLLALTLILILAHTLGHLAQSPV